MVKIIGPQATVTILPDNELRVEQRTTLGYLHCGNQHVALDMARLLSGSTGAHPDTVVFLLSHFGVFGVA